MSVIARHNRNMYRVSFDIANRRGKIGAFPNSVLINFSEVFTGTPRYNRGSSFEIIERLTISTRIYDPKLVDIDFNWFDPKYYLGSFQLIDSSGNYAAKLEDQGYLYALDQTIERRTINTVAYDQANIQFGTGGSAISTCNFYLEPAVYLFPGDTVPTPGYQVAKPKDSFITQNSEGAAPILDKPFDRQIRGVQLFLLPGVEGVVINYEAFPAQTVEMDLSPADVASCVFLNPDCNVEFAAFLQQSPGTKFESEQLATEYATTNAILADVIPNTYVCSTNPVFIYTYYTLRPRPLSCASAQDDYLARNPISPLGGRWFRSIQEANAAIDIDRSAFTEGQLGPLYSRLYENGATILVPESGTAICALYEIKWTSRVNGVDTGTGVL